MKFNPSLVPATIPVVAIASLALLPGMARAQNYYVGQASGGQRLNVDLTSISRASARSVDFAYYLGGERIQSQANCQAGTWTTFPERQVQRPQSQGTQKMLELVCNYQGRSNGGTARVMDPPSNIRATPNGEIMCTIRERTSINLYGATGNWYYTDACGQMGMIHTSQIRVSR